MPLATLITGPYSASWNSVAVGKTREGFDLRWQWKKETITVDTYGDSVIDSIYRGADVFVLWLGVEYSSMTAVAWPYAATFGETGLLGRLDVGSTMTKTMVMTSTALTPAAAAPATLTSTNSIVDDDQVESKFAMRLREVPVKLRLYIYNSTNDKFFSTT
jgi:hypothetical protein